MENFKVTATDSAIDRIREITADEPQGTNLRISVQGGGCAGFSYGFTLDSDLTMEDFVCDLGTDVKVVIDAMSAQYLNDSRIDYKEDLMNCNFTIDNPNAETSCGCGSSFSPY